MRSSLPSISAAREGSEREALESGDDGRADLAGVGRAEDEEDAVGRLLERLEEDVPALLDALDLVDDEDLVAQVGRSRIDARHELAHVVDLVVGRGIELDDVEGPPFADGRAAGTGVAGLAIAQVGAVDRLGEDAGHGGLARATRSDEEEAMAEAPEADGVAERLDDGRLSDHLGERLGAEAPIECLLGGAWLRRRGGALCHPLHGPCAADRRGPPAVRRRTRTELPCTLRRSRPPASPTEANSSDQAGPRHPASSA